MCEAFLQGWCPDGVACRRKHLTRDMVRRLRAGRKLQPAKVSPGSDGSSVCPAIALRTATSRTITSLPLSRFLSLP